MILWFTAMHQFWFWVLCLCRGIGYHVRFEEFEASRGELSYARLAAGDNGFSLNILMLLLVWGSVYQLYRPQELEIIDGSSKLEHEATQVA